MLNIIDILGLCLKYNKGMVQTQVDRLSRVIDDRFKENDPNQSSKFIFLS